MMMMIVVKLHPEASRTSAGE